jgi:hypothetical protein
MSKVIFIDGKRYIHYAESSMIKQAPFYVNEEELGHNPDLAEEEALIGVCAHGVAPLLCDDCFPDILPEGDSI